MSKRTTWEGVVIYTVRTLINKQQEQRKNMSKNMGKNSSLSKNKNMGRKTKKKGLKQDKG
jgi:hypothetical protein